MNFFQAIPDLTIGQFTKFAVLIKKAANITLSETKITMLSNRLRKRLRVLNLNDFDEYYALLTGPDGDKEMVFFLEVITTNESYFWRTIKNFDILKENILPVLLKEFSGETLKFWSAGCSTGEEPYNIAMELTESMKTHGVFNFEILATDISKRVIEFAQIGSYTGRKLEKVPPAILTRYFVRSQDEPDQYTVRPDIKKRVTFRVSNLFEDLPENRHCIFCRNVMIYFSRDVQEVLVQRFYKALKPGGFLVIGHSESLQLMKSDFKPVSFENGIVYRKQNDS